jgi:hypothetical protein
MSVERIAKQILNCTPEPIRSGLRRIVRRFKRAAMSLEQRVNIGVGERPAYAFCLYYGALTAKRLGYSRISALEFGVAGGNGIIALQKYACEIKRELGIDVEIYGFDSGAGLPKPRDFRDIPYMWQTGFYPIDEAKLRVRLKGSQLVMGDVAETAKTFFDDYNPAPIGAAFFDLDFYCYFDDTTSDGLGALNDYTGERLAIGEFNESHEHQKFAALCLYTQCELWQRRLWVFHNFIHSKYSTFIMGEFLSMPLDR